MKVEDTNIPGVKVLKLDAYEDARGCFVQVFEKSEMANAGIKDDFIQDAVSVSTFKHTVRGLHFQNPPYEQSKLVSCDRGAFFDVAVDLRQSSLTYGQHFSIELTDTSWTAVYLPVGIAHGFCTLQDDTRLVYKFAGKYAPEDAGGLLWNDSGLAIDWPVKAEDVLINERDMAMPSFDPVTLYFS